MQHYIGDIDNIQMCGEIIIQMNNDFTLNASILVDEWRPEWTFKQNNRNWFGYLFGMGKKGLFSKKDSYKIEYVWTDHRIYRHKFPINYSYTYNYPLGFWGGPHSEYFFSRYSASIADWEASIILSYFKRGKLTEEMLINQYENIFLDNLRYSKGHEERIVYEINIYKYIYNNTKLEIGGEWIRWSNPGFNPTSQIPTNKEIKKLSLNLGLTIETDFIFN